jgi:flagellar basal body rod protein FlgG
MSRDIYTSVAGASATWRQLEVAAHNIANVNTTAFKEQRVAFEIAEREEAPLSATHVRLSVDGADLTDGSIIEDGVDTHLALRGRGFFQVEGPDGAVLVRSGRFQMDSEHRLVTERGETVMGRSGPIEIPEGTLITVAEDGTIMTNEGDELDTLLIMDAGEIVPLGNGRWAAQGATTEAQDVRVVQGALEGSNVDPVKSMVRLMEAARSFEMFQKAMQTSDRMDEQLNQMAKV